MLSSVRGSKIESPANKKGRLRGKSFNEMSDERRITRHKKRTAGSQYQPQEIVEKGARDIL
jgi:hypothetical protein